MREEEDNLHNEKIIIKVPTIVETYIVLNNIEKNDSNFLHAVNGMLDCAVDLIISNGDIDISLRVNNIIENVNLVAKYNNIHVLLDGEDGYKSVKDGIYDIMESLLTKSEHVHPGEYNYIVETIVNNSIVIVIRKK